MSLGSLWHAPSSRSAAIAVEVRLMKSSDSTVISVIFNVGLNVFFAFINLCRATFGTLGFRMTESPAMLDGNRRKVLARPWRLAAGV